MKNPKPIRALYERAFTEDPTLTLKGAYLRAAAIALSEGYAIGGPQPAVAVDVRRKLGIAPGTRGRPAVAAPVKAAKASPKVETVATAKVPPAVLVAAPARPEGALREAVRALRVAMAAIGAVSVTVTPTTATCRRMVDEAVDA